jgi:hypothetical protein
MKSSFYIHKSVIEDGFTGQQFDTPQEGFAVVCRGASGRFCEVMHGSKASWETCGISRKDLLTAEQGRALIRKQGNGYPDF